MAIGVVSRYDLCDVADAIRARNGSNDTYLPSEMAAAIRALDGTEVAPGAVMPCEGTPYGLLDDSVLAGIADAIRAQNGTSARYRTSEMAEAILALTWVPLAPRALLCSDGTLEFTYLASEASPSGREVAKVVPLPEATPTAMGDTPWYAERGSIARVAFDGSFSGTATPSMDYWFDNLNQLVEVTGLRYVAGCASMRAAMGHDTKLATVDLSGMDLSGLADVSELFIGDSALSTVWMSAGQEAPAGAKGTLTFAGCVALAGGAGTAFSAKHVTGDYLRPDAEGAPGYGTLLAP